MSRYLSALKISENAAGAHLKNLNNLPLPSSLGSLGSSPPHSEINQAANDTENSVDTLTFFAWLIHYADRDPVLVTFSPMATHSAALACYPEAVAAEPVPDTPSRTATAEESAHLAILMTAIYGSDSDDERTEARQAARADPDGALTCYTAIASERGLTVANANADDRHTCDHCGNLRQQVCTIAKPEHGALVVANRGYRPDPARLLRCEGYAPLTNNSGQRIGVERRPRLIQKGGE